MLLERRSIAELEDILAERLQRSAPAAAAPPSAPGTARRTTAHITCQRTAAGRAGSLACSGNTGHRGAGSRLSTAGRLISVGLHRGGRIPPDVLSTHVLSAARPPRLTRTRRGPNTPLAARGRQADARPPARQRGTTPAAPAVTAPAGRYGAQEAPDAAPASQRRSRRRRRCLRAPAGGPSPGRPGTGASPGARSGWRAGADHRLDR
jgi:hypothetical protein